MEQKGCVIRKMESSVWDDDKKPMYNCWSVEYDNPEGEIRYAIVKAKSAGVTIVSDEPIDTWFASKLDPRALKSFINKGDSDYHFDDFKMMVHIAEKMDYRHAPAYEHMEKMFMQILADPQNAIVLSEQELLTQQEAIQNDKFTFTAVLQQVRLLHLEHVEDHGRLELMVDGSDLNLQWNCEGEQPDRILTLSAIA